MKTLLTTIMSLLSVFHATEQNNGIEGLWKTVDDRTGETESIIEIFQKPDGKYYGKIKEMLVKPINERCIKCRDDRKNAPLLGLEVIRGLAPDNSGHAYTGGTITDPKNGKTYKCTVTRSGGKLLVRGYTGVSLLGRTQTWHLAK